MESLAWIVLLALMLAAVHVVVAVYLYRSAGSDNAATTAGAFVDRREERSRPAATARTESGGVPCPACGVTNDPSFRFCRRCVSDLSGGGPAAGGPESTGKLGS